MVNYADLKASIDDYYNENIAHRDKTDKLVEASMSSLDKSSHTINDPYKGLNIITKLLKEIKNAVKDDSAHAVKQDEELAAWAKSSTNMAWNLDARLSGLEQAQNHIQSSMSSLKEDTHSIKNMMTEMYEVFKGQSSDIPPTQAQPITTITTHPESSQAAPRIDKRKGIATESDKDPLKKLVLTSTIVRLDPDKDVKVPYMINRKMCYLIDKEMQAYLDREEKLRKAAKEERLLAISKPKVIKVVQKDAQKIGLDPNKIVSAKAGEKKYKFENYMWTINNRLKPETITDIKIHPKTKPVVITVYRVVQDFMNSLSRRYERIRKIPEELGIKSALPALAPAPEQASSKSLRKKRKHMPDYKIFFTNEFGDKAFQRWSDIDKVRMEALVSYLVATSMVQSPKNARFNI
ncbi:hypothetical protein Tco_1015170 [Tanacetum coccineum]|uniref:Uncharacterized protein n=1 Tax=Tanacetum coccineum TaxID=301880 RepID=A0ABQ5FL59_9ASTR